MRSLISVIVIGAYTGAIGAQENPACKDEITAAHLCDESFRLWDLSQRLDKEMDICTYKNMTCNKKLEVLTATTVVHTRVVEVSRPTTTFEDIIAVVGGVALLCGGFALGRVIGH